MYIRRELEKKEKGGPRQRRESMHLCLVGGGMGRGEDGMVDLDHTHFFESSRNEKKVGETNLFLPLFDFILLSSSYLFRNIYILLLKFHFNTINFLSFHSIFNQTKRKISRITLSLLPIFSLYHIYQTTYKSIIFLISFSLLILFLLYLSLLYKQNARLKGESWKVYKLIFSFSFTSLFLLSFIFNSFLLYLIHFSHHFELPGVW